MAEAATVSNDYNETGAWAPEWDDEKILWWDRSPYNQGITNMKPGYLRLFLLF